MCLEKDIVNKDFIFKPSWWKVVMNEEYLGLIRIINWTFKVMLNDYGLKENKGFLKVLKSPKQD